MQRRPTLLPRNSRPFVHNIPSVTSVSRTCEHSLSSKSNRRAACASVRRNPGISRVLTANPLAQRAVCLGESIRSGRRAVSVRIDHGWSPVDWVDRRPLSNHRAGCDGRSGGTSNHCSKFRSPALHPEESATSNFKKSGFSLALQAGKSWNDTCLGSDHE